MQEELLQFKLQKVWTLIDLPYGKRAIGTKWVFRNKKDEICILIRNKARLLKQGHTQEEGKDYDQIFSSVARIEALRLFLAYASFKHSRVLFCMKRLKKRYTFINLQDLKILTFLIKCTKLKKHYMDFIKLLEHVSFQDIRLIERLLCDNSSSRLPKEFGFENSNANIESFSPSPIPIKDSDCFMEAIDFTFNPDDPMPPGIEDDDYDSEWNILIREELLDNYSFSLPVIESYHFDIPSFSRPPAKPPDGNSGILNVKMMGDNSKQKVPIPGLTITRVSNQEKSPDLLSHRSLEIFKLSAKCPMMIHRKNIPILDVPLFHFTPLDQLNYGGIGPILACCGGLVESGLQERYRLIKMEEGVAGKGFSVRLTVHVKNEYDLVLSLHFLVRASLMFCMPFESTPMVSSQDKYVAEILKKYSFLEVKNASTPMETQKPILKDEDGEEVDVHMYRYQVNPKALHLHVMKRILESIADEAVNEEMDDRLVRVATAAFSLEAEQDIGGGPRRQDTMGDVVAHIRVLALEAIKTTQTQEIDSLKRRVKKLEKKQRPRTHKLKRLYKVGLYASVESSDDEGLGIKDASKQGRIIDDLDADEDITLVSDAATTVTTDDITLAKALEALKTSKPKIRGIVIKDHDEPNESRTTTTISLKKSQDNGKAKMIEEPVKLKKKDQILFDEEAEEQQELNEEEKAKLFMELLEKRIKFFAANSAKEKRNRPAKKAQQRAIITELIEESSKKVEVEITQEESSKRARDKLEQETTKKQKIVHGKETTNLKHLLKITPEEDIAIDAIPLAIKTPIVDWKIYKEQKRAITK
nr:retrovirus-related Pol polyprotein from transposon TNT 1-94 [Tanacetum cinerariifolium]